ncbi:hypothetical protein ACFWJ4_11235 [Kitasatospora sp. NPDC127067]|uniref:hypothetical protein n=1 Tax=Kitasatospora sp. NPDC127067 TaxID=3347126 RepID=UPI0036580D48
MARSVTEAETAPSACAAALRRAASVTGAGGTVGLAPVHAEGVTAAAGTTSVDAAVAVRRRSERSRAVSLARRDRLAPTR